MIETQWDSLIFFARKWIIFASVFCLGGRQLLCQASFFVSKTWTMLEIDLCSPPVPQSYLTSPALKQTAAR